MYSLTAAGPRKNIRIPYILAADGSAADHLVQVSPALGAQETLDKQSAAVQKIAMAKEPTVNKSSAETTDEIKAVPNCGVVRPIANVEGYPDGHWLEVHQIIVEAATVAGFNARLVSDDEAIGVILGRIVSNLHDDPIAVIDVSGLNPNVMFELGMRLAFDKPVVVIKDNITRYPFDASPIEYVPYPSDLRHSPLMAFKEKLIAAIRNTSDLSSKPNYRSFLKHFGSYKPGELGDDQTLGTRLILDEMQSLKSLIRRSPIDFSKPLNASPISEAISRYTNSPSQPQKDTITCRVSISHEHLSALIAKLDDESSILGTTAILESSNQYLLRITPTGRIPRAALVNRIFGLVDAHGGSATEVL